METTGSMTTWIITAAEKENNRYIYFEEHTLNGGLPLREKGYTMKGGGE